MTYLPWPVISIGAFLFVSILLTFVGCATILLWTAIPSIKNRGFKAMDLIIICLAVIMIVATVWFVDVNLSEGGLLEHEEKITT